MSRRRVRLQLNDVRGVKNISEEDIKKILRAADEIIFRAGRSMLAKILKGSKDKKLLENGLDKCPSYGYYKDKTINEITIIVDWMIINHYLDIEYDGKLPLIIFSPIGWEIYKPIYVDELYNRVLNSDRCDWDKIIDEFKNKNREIVIMLLDKIGLSKNIGFIRFLNEWKAVEVKKIRQKISFTINQLKSI